MELYIQQTWKCKSGCACACVCVCCCFVCYVSIVTYHTLTVTSQFAAHACFKWGCCTGSMDICMYVCKHRCVYVCTYAILYVAFVFELRLGQICDISHTTCLHSITYVCRYVCMYFFSNNTRSRARLISFASSHTLCHRYQALLLLWLLSHLLLCATTQTITKLHTKQDDGQQAEAQLVEGVRELLIFRTFESFARHLATLATPHKCYANCCSHSLTLYPRSQPCRIHTCMCFIFHNRNFFSLLLLLRAFSRTQTQHSTVHTCTHYRHSGKFGFACLAACCAQLLLLLSSPLHTMLCCYHCICFVLHILAQFRTICAALAHTCTRAG